MDEKMKSCMHHSELELNKCNDKIKDDEDHTFIEGYVNKMNLYRFEDGSYKAPFYLVVTRRSKSMPIECIAYKSVAVSLVKDFKKEQQKKQEIKLCIKGHLQSYPLNGRPVTTVVVDSYKIVR